MSVTMTTIVTRILRLIVIYISVKVSLLAPPEVSFHYELSFFKSGNTAVNVQPGGKVGAKIL